MIEAVQHILSFVRIIAEFINNFFGRFMNNELQIFGVPFYIWVVVIFVVFYLFSLLEDIIE